MTDISSLAAQILKNCDISDARYAGMFSVCGLALRLRDLYKWEAGLPPWEERDTADILGWIGEREERWAALSQGEFATLRFNGTACDPFDTETANGWLESQGYVYGAGMALGLKPTFFLAPIKAHFAVEGFSVIVAGKELARDLLTLPALTQDRRILLRGESAMAVFWDQMIYLKKSGRPYLRYAVGPGGGGDISGESLRRHTERLFDVQKEIYVRHEIGELSDETFLLETWREVIADHPQSPVELLARALKDLLADTHPLGTLPHLIRTRNGTGLVLYAAFLDGLMRSLFCRFRPACDAWMQNGSWGDVESAVEISRSRFKELARELTEIHREGRNRGDTDWARGRIGERLLAPLGIAWKENG